MNNLFEQFEKDVYEHGKLAFTLYQVSLSNKDKFIDAVDNKDVEFALNSVNYDVRRKESVALPFDLEQAKAGDVVEWRNNCDYMWDICEFVSESNDNGFFEIISSCGIDKKHVLSNELRMKYPPKANHE